MAVMEIGKRAEGVSPKKAKEQKASNAITNYFAKKT